MKRLLEPCAVVVLLLGLAESVNAQCKPWTFNPMRPGLGLGSGVALDGSRALISSWQDGGTVHVYERTSIAWLETATLTPPAGSTTFGFGNSVALDGDVAVVPVPFDDEAAENAGAVYIFEHGPHGWAFLAKLFASDAVEGGRFGTEVSVDGGQLAVSSARVFLGDGSTVPAAVYVFERVDGAGGPWMEVARLQPDDVLPYDSYGQAIDLERDLLLVGSPYHPSQEYSLESPGAAYLFGRVGGAWTLLQKLGPEVGAGGERFGHGVALSERTAFIGAPAKTLPPFQIGQSEFGLSGSAYVFEESGSSWSQINRVDSPGLMGEVFVTGVGWDLQANEDVLASNTYYIDGKHRVVTFRRLAGVWTPTEVFVGGAGNFGSWDWFAEEWSLWGELLLIGEASVDNSYPGAPFDSNSGRAHLHYLNKGFALKVCNPWLSLSNGGMQKLTLSAGMANANLPFLILGSASGTHPGVALGEEHLPLNLDPYLLATLTNPDQWIVNSLGTLGPYGGAVTHFVLPAGSDASLLGTVLHHAFVVLDPAAPAGVKFASKAAELHLTP